ncbi:pyridoxamine 5'-phosphate oxidase family protein [Actinopolymorpha cephalotaxi]|uniref:Pyridoxamine 5'-phosphate oxidase family protein n=1 Tax=Actinopolymorpha cephalotaxi TaxID=504797 RepID=A0A1I2WVB7_9ACTN|nr:PPOX class F420-dependent oxidoreductase [Actinopolymorpha cephalotaxi]NYH85144.1 pyridoxamine 5'-phosphate oxidase family protein [Actinopolymorpha cephalotaxi]SFH05192.1 pyridoxamine 5'-phosphate oxidase family protein [Actinopolymorpha cephalotaxi]
MTFTQTELRYLLDQPLGRLATLGPGGPQITPVAFWVDTSTHRIEISGPNFGTSRKVRNIHADPRVSFVVDDMAAEPVGPGGQTGRGLEIRARAEIVSAGRPLREGFGNVLVRLHPRRILAWNLDGPGPHFRDV